MAFSPEIIEKGFTNNAAFSACGKADLIAAVSTPSETSLFNTEGRCWYYRIGDILTSLSFKLRRAIRPLHDYLQRTLVRFHNGVIVKNV